MILFTGDLIDAKLFFQVLERDSSGIVIRKKLDTDFLESVKEFCQELMIKAGADCEAYYTPGNHDVHHLTKDDGCSITR